MANMIKIEAYLIATVPSTKTLYKAYGIFSNKKKKQKKKKSEQKQ